MSSCSAPVGANITYKDMTSTYRRSYRFQTRISSCKRDFEVVLGHVSIVAHPLLTVINLVTES